MNEATRQHRRHVNKFSFGAILLIIIGLVLSDNLIGIAFIAAGAILICFAITQLRNGPRDG